MEDSIGSNLGESVELMVDWRAGIRQKKRNRQKLCSKLTINSITPLYVNSIFLE